MKTFALAVRLSIGTTGFRSFDLAEQLAPFFSTVIDESFHVFAQRFDGVSHLRIEAPRPREASDEIVERLEDLAVPR